MKFRYKEMIYRPDYYIFHTEDRTEWFPNGIYNYNVSRMISDLSEYELNPDGDKMFLNKVIRTEIQVQDEIGKIGCLGNLQDEHINAANIKRPLIYVEVAPDAYGLIDGHHRLEKARRAGIESLSAYFINAHIAIMYLGSEEEYCDYVKYWNSKVEERQDDDYTYSHIPGVSASLIERNMNPEHIWNNIEQCLKECRRVEVYNYEDEWFTLFRLNGRVFCGEAESYASIKCAVPFAITKESLSDALHYFGEWDSKQQDKKSRKELRKQIRRNIRHADILMACIRVFSEY